MMGRRTREWLVDMVWTAACTLIICAVALFCCYVGSNYEREATVVRVERGIGITTFEDSTGHLWQYYTTDYAVGDEVVLEMGINGTENYFEDDVIKDVELR
jgi:hypothetical protein